MTTRLIDCDLLRNPSISPQVKSCIITARQRSCGQVMFSVVSVCQSFCLQGGGGGTPCMGPWPPPIPPHAQTCSNLFKLDIAIQGPQGPHPNMFKFVYLKHRLSSSGQLTFDLQRYSQSHQLLSYWPFPKKAPLGTTPKRPFPIDSFMVGTVG